MNWLDYEISDIYSRIRMKTSKEYDNMMLKKCLILAAAFLMLFATGHADCIVSRQTTIVSHEEIECKDILNRDFSATWRCKGCGIYTWKSEPDDWMGNYYCDVCGKRMGDE